MKAHRALIARAALATSLCLLSGTTRAQGIPVMDIDSIIQAILDVSQSLQQIENQIAQIKQFETQIKAISGMRNLGQILDSPLLHNYVPTSAVSTISSIENGGYSGLSGTAKALRDAHMTYNCLDKEGDARTNCQSVLAQPYQQKAFMQDAMTAANGRLAQIQSLMGQIDATDDAKGVAEIQARLQAESSLLQHEQTRIDMANGLASAQARIDESRSKEQQLQQASRTGRLADYTN